MPERPRIPDAILDAGAVAILRGLPSIAVVDTAQAIRAGGIEAVEITLDSPTALESIKALSRRGWTVGAGTVLTLQEAEHAVVAGASFLVAPDSQIEVISWAAGRGVPILPGAFTATEILSAWRAGAAAVKLFPATAVDPAYLQALRAPLAGIPLIPAGGITSDNAQAWRDAGAVAVAVGSWLTASTSPAEITERAAAVRRG
jgi:2-dehydro-3-deoxyphosphogluconate aldolase/(4S)-4-hydroxy-2-oxoglutarate aldolase